MFLEVDIFAGIRIRNRSQKPITIFFETISVKYPIKRYIPFCYVISAITVEEYVTL
jgi:hypothetical protein